MTNQHMTTTGTIHRATVASLNFDHEDSVSTDTKLPQLANIAVGEQISIYNGTTGVGFETYKLSGANTAIFVNGAAPQHAGRRRARKHPQCVNEDV